METGDVVKWYAGNILCRGIVRQEFEENVDVVCFEVNNMATKRLINVKKDLIIKDEV